MKSRSTKSRLLSVALAALLVFTLLPALTLGASAATPLTANEPSFASAATVEVADLTELNTAITSAGTTPTIIKLTADIEFTGATDTIVIPVGAVINLTGGTIDAKGECTVIAVLGQLLLTDITITGGNATTIPGGGVSVDTGGEVYVRAGTSIVGNKAEYGGGIGVNEGAGAWVIGGEISDNFATEDGGGIYTLGTVDVISGTICQNYAAKNGGGVSVAYADLNLLTVRNTARFFDNRAGGGANALVLSSADQGVYNTQIKGEKWSTPFVNGYNNYDISFTKTLAKINTAASTSLTINKYALGTDDVPGNAGTGLAVEPADLPAGATPLDGVPFTVYLIKDLKVPYNYGLYEIDTLPGGTKWADPSKAAALDSLDVIINGSLYTLEKVDTKTTASGKVVFDNSDGITTGGIYLVVEGTANGVKKPANPFMVELPMVNPKPSNVADTFLYNVNVYPKNETIDVEKEATDAELAVKVGDIRTYQITIEVPADYADLTTFALTDPLNAALDLVTTAGSVEINFVDNSGATPVDHKLNNTQVAALITGSVTSHPDTLEVKLDKTSVEAAGFTIPAKFDHIVVTFKVQVNEYVSELEVTYIENTAEVDLGDGSKIKSNTDRKIHVSQIEIIKTDENGGAPLAGAKFIILYGDYDPTDPTLDPLDFALLYNPTTKTILYPYDTDYADAVDGTISGYSIWEVETDSDGLASFFGILDGDKDTSTVGAPLYRTYYLKETVAPGDYILIDEPIAVTFDADSSTLVATTDPVTGNVTYTYSYTLQASITNTNKEFELPHTGGNGLLFFTIAGVALVGAGAVVLITRKKKEEN